MSMMMFEIKVTPKASKAEVTHEVHYRNLAHEFWEDVGYIAIRQGIDVREVFSSANVSTMEARVYGKFPNRLSELLSGSVRTVGDIRIVSTFIVRSLMYGNFMQMLLETFGIKEWADTSRISLNLAVSLLMMYSPLGLSEAITAQQGRNIGLSVDLLRSVGTDLNDNTGRVGKQLEPERSSAPLPSGAERVPAQNSVQEPGKDEDERLKLMSRLWYISNFSLVLPAAIALVSSFLAFQGAMTVMQALSAERAGVLTQLAAITEAQTKERTNLMNSQSSLISEIQKHAMEIGRLEVERMKVQQMQQPKVSEQMLKATPITPSPPSGTSQ